MHAIKVDQLTKLYPLDIKAVDGANFAVDEGEVYGYLGPNGAGKTTTIKMIMGNCMSFLTFPSFRTIS